MTEHPRSVQTLFCNISIAAAGGVTVTVVNFQKESFGLYALYSKNKPQSDLLLQEHGNEFFKTKQMELGDKMDLASYLLKPVQRMGACQSTAIVFASVTLMSVLRDWLVTRVYTVWISNDLSRIDACKVERDWNAKFFLSPRYFNRSCRI